MTSISALLSQILVAFTIELDNEFEHLMPHVTTDPSVANSGRTGPWLTSFAMYANCLQFLGEAPLSVQQLQKQARTSTNLDGMRRWGYIKLTPSPEHPGRKSPDASWLIEPTPAGLLAQQTWAPLAERVEQRWRDRFGPEAIHALRDILRQINLELDVAYPDFLPILGYGFFTRGKGPGDERPMPSVLDAPLSPGAPLTALLSRLLCAFAYDFERESPISLAISANLLRTLDATGLRNRDLPLHTGVSKESINMAIGVLEKAHLVTIGHGATKTISLTARGLASQEAALERLVAVERYWTQRFGEPRLHQLRRALEALLGNTSQHESLLFQGLKPYPDNWRASRPDVRTLPHFPMVLHRGGYPDGS